MAMSNKMRLFALGYVNLNHKIMSLAWRLVSPTSKSALLPRSVMGAGLFLLARQRFTQAVTRVTVKRCRLSSLVFERSSAVVLDSRADTAIRRPLEELRSLPQIAV
jgi:hypothetical protein